MSTPSIQSMLEALQTVPTQFGAPDEHDQTMDAMAGDEAERKLQASMAAHSHRSLRHTRCARGSSR